MDGISALMDGELGDGEAQGQIARLKSDGEIRERWDEFHLIGDALRGEPLLSSRFAQTFSQRLAAEPTVLAPRRIIRKPGRTLTYALSAAASVSAAALVAWVAIAPTAQVSPQLASTTAPATAAATASVKTAALAEPVPQPLSSLPSEGHIKEFLLAHEGLSPSSTLQGLAPYIRTVSTTRPGDGR